MFGGKLEAGRIVGSIEMMVPVSGEMVMVAGETTRLSSLSNMTARVETRVISETSES